MKIKKNVSLVNVCFNAQFILGEFGSRFTRKVKLKDEKIITD